MKLKRRNFHYTSLQVCILSILESYWIHISHIQICLVHLDACCNVTPKTSPSKKHNTPLPTLTQVTQLPLPLQTKKTYHHHSSPFRLYISPRYLSPIPQPLTAHKRRAQRQETTIDWNCARPHGWWARAACHGSSRTSTSMDGEEVGFSGWMKRGVDDF